MSSKSGPAPKSKSRRPRGPRRKKASRLPLILLGLGALICAGVAGAMFAGVLPNPLAPPPAPPAASVVVPKQPPNDTRLQVTALRSNARPAGLAVRSAAGGEPAPGSEASDLGPGGLLRTDASTRVGLAGSDGSQLVVNHDSELGIDVQTPRTFRLERGELLADVPRQPGAVPLHLQSPHGSLETDGAKLVLTVTPGATSVRVARGSVKLQGASGQAIEVRAGQEGIVTPSAPASAQAMLGLGSLLDWAELPQDTGEPVAEMAGLGRLDARLPDDPEAKEHPLLLANHAVQVRVSGAMARTEVEETFQNDGDAELEGIYRFPLPADARLVELALEVDGEWQSGAFVEREQGQRIWRGVIRNAKKQKKAREPEEYLWVPGPWRDPALLQWQSGNSFELRVFPIPAQGARKIRLAYTQRLSAQPGSRRYVYPLPGSGSDATAARFAIDIDVLGADASSLVAHGYALQPGDAAEGSARLTFASEAFVANGELVVDVPDPGDAHALRSWTFQGSAALPAGKGLAKTNPRAAAAQDALAADERAYVAIALRPDLPALEQDSPRAYTLVLDSSQSMYGDRFRRAVQVVEHLIADMDRRDVFRLMACDLHCQHLTEGAIAPSSQAASQARSWLDALRPAGSTDLSATLRRVEEALKTNPRPEDRQRIVWIGDGTSTVGAREVSELTEQVRALVGDPLRSFSSIGIGADADSLVLASLARAGRGHFVPHVPGESASATALALLGSGYAAALANAALQLPAGLVDAVPGRLPTLQAGEELLVAARMDGSELKGDLVLTGQVAGEDFERRYPIELVASAAEGNRFVPGLWAGETIDRLEREGGPEAQDRIVALSVGFGVMSRRTSLIVLESQAMQEAFGVDAAVDRPAWTGEEPEDLESADADEVYDLETEGAPAAAERAPKRKAEISKSAVLDSLGGLGSEGAAMDDVASGARTRAPEGPPKKRGAVDGQWMKKEWYRKAEISVEAPVRKSDLRAMDEAVRALEDNPQSRDRHRDLVRALSRLGNLERAHKVLGQWIERDARDPEALTYLSDAVGRGGDQREALRLLSGVVDLVPDDTRLHERLARAFDRAGMAEQACAHREALAHLAPADATRLADAIRCLRALERTAAAERRLSAIGDEKLRAKVAESAAVEQAPLGAKGDLLLSASWEPKVDLDLSLITPQGTRVSWMGGRVNAVGDDAADPNAEVIGFARVTAGTYTIEIARTNPHDKTDAEGTLTIDVLEEQRKVPFKLTRDRMALGRIVVRRMSRLVAH